MSDDLTTEDSCALGALPGFCGPCTGATPKLTADEVTHYRRETPDWVLWSTQAGDARGIARTFKFRNYVEAMRFLSSLTDVFEREGHHADHRLYEWCKIEFVLTTHAIKGLSVNDFVVARKIDEAWEAHKAETVTT